jgi:hypothetical protein
MGLRKAGRTGGITSYSRLAFEPGHLDPVRRHAPKSITFREFRLARHSLSNPREKQETGARLIQKIGV